jgi:hypothetical protein
MPFNEEQALSNVDIDPGGGSGHFSTLRYALTALRSCIIYPLSISLPTYHAVTDTLSNLPDPVLSDTVCAFKESHSIVSDFVR